MFFGYIPRGKGKAPKQVAPKEEFTTEQLKPLLSTAKSNVDGLSTLDKIVNFNHPYFGVLNKKQTVKFLGIHTHHHLKIIKDILK